MGHETLKRIILEKYAEDNYLVLGNKNTKDCCGVCLEEALDNIRKQMKGNRKHEDKKELKGGKNKDE